MITAPPHSSAPVRPGDVLAGKYRVDGVLGVGGMGVVVAATHLQLGQRVAIKFLLPEALRLGAALERFAREARAAAQLRSENVARVIDVAALETGAPYMVMELLDGADLAAVIVQRGPLPVGEAVDYVVQACDAIAEAHALGIVHRDLKPKNLFLTRKRNGAPLVKVLDFGISKVAAAGDDHSLTKTSDVMGSPNYMAPEQIRSARDVDARTDVWALGVILYELLTGHVPFEAETVPQLCSMVLEQQPPPLSHVRPDVPAQIVAVVDRCLAKHPAARFQSVSELVAALVPGAYVAPPSSFVQTMPPTPVSPMAMSSVAVVAAEGTSVTLGRSAPEAKKRSTGAILGGVAVLAVVAVGVTAFELRHAGGPETPAGPPSAPAPSAITAATSASPPVAPSSSATASAAPSASSPRAPSSHTAPWIPPPPATAKPTATSKPAPTPGETYLPDERK